MDDPNKILYRSQCLRFAFQIIQNFQIKSKTRDEVLYLVDIMLAKENYNQKNPELLCVTCLFFVLKLEDDFSSSFHQVFQMLMNSLNLKLEEIKRYEIFILSSLPSFFILLPNIKIIAQMLLKNLSHEVDQKFDVEKVEEFCLQRYMSPINDLSFANLIVEPLVNMAFTGDRVLKAYDILRAVFISNHIDVQT